MTVRGWVHEMQQEILQTELTPTRAAEIDTKLTALLGNVMSECRQADAAFNVVLLSFYESEEAASRAKIRAETTPEYARKREAKDTEKLCVELIRSLRQYQRTSRTEMDLSR
jgi:hypothetical protein